MRSLTGGDIWALALTAHKAHVERMRSLLLDLDDDDLADTCSGLHGHDVAAPHDDGPFFSLPMQQQQQQAAASSGAGWSACRAVAGELLGVL